MLSSSCRNCLSPFIPIIWKYLTAVVALYSVAFTLLEFAFTERLLHSNFFDVQDWLVQGVFLLDMLRDLRIGWDRWRHFTGFRKGLVFFCFSLINSLQFNFPTFRIFNNKRTNNIFLKFMAKKGSSFPLFLLHVIQLGASNSMEKLKG